MFGISVCGVEPGGFQTNILDLKAYAERKEKQWDSLPQELKEEYGEDYRQEGINVYIWYNNR